MQVTIYNGELKEAHKLYEQLYNIKINGVFVHVSKIIEALQDKTATGVVYLCDMNEDDKDFVRGNTDQVQGQNKSNLMLWNNYVRQQSL